MAYEIYDAEFRKLAKRANQRMVELERRGLAPGAYKQVQGELAFYDRNTAEGRGARFSETGKGTRAMIDAQKSTLKRFLESRQSTLTGLKQIRKETIEASKESLGDWSEDLSDDEYFEMWDALPEDVRDRSFGSQTVVTMVQAAVRNAKDAGDDYSITDIVEAIQSAGSMEEAMRFIGITYEDLDAVEGLEGNE